MIRDTRERPDAAWRRFVVEHGHGASARDLAFILRRSDDDISQLKATGACSKSAARKNFVALFQLWYGREPKEGDWPPPRKIRCGEYEWQAPELALLAPGRPPRQSRDRPDTHRTPATPDQRSRGSPGRGRRTEHD